VGVGAGIRSGPAGTDPLAVSDGDPSPGSQPVSPIRRLSSGWTGGGLTRSPAQAAVPPVDPQRRRGFREPGPDGIHGFPLCASQNRGSSSHPEAPQSIPGLRYSRSHFSAGCPSLQEFDSEVIAERTRINRANPWAKDDWFGAHAFVRFFSRFGCRAEALRRGPP
jgi:hypothetical protein